MNRVLSVSFLQSAFLARKFLKSFFFLTQSNLEFNLLKVALEYKCNRYWGNSLYF